MQRTAEKGTDEENKMYREKMSQYAVYYLRDGDRSRF